MVHILMIYDKEDIGRESCVLMVTDLWLAFSVKNSRDRSTPHLWQLFVFLPQTI